MGPPWIRQNGEEVARRYPFLGAMIQRLATVSGSGFAMMVLIMFALVTGITLITALFGLFNLWAGAVVVFLLHFLVHIGQFVAYRAHFPVIITSVPGAFWCIASLYVLNERTMLDLQQTVPWTLFGLVLTAVWLTAAHRLGTRFDHWLRRAFPQGF